MCSKRECVRRFFARAPTIDAFLRSGIICTCALCLKSHMQIARSHFDFFTNPHNSSEYMFLAWNVYTVNIKLYSKRIVSVCLGSAHLIPDSELSVGLSNARAAVTVLNYFFSCISLRGCVFTYDAFIKAGAPERAFEKQATHHYNNTCVLAWMGCALLYHREI
jgi:hypothetical protein